MQSTRTLLRAGEKGNGAVASASNEANGDSAQGLRVSLLKPVYAAAEDHCSNFCRNGCCQGLDFDPTGRSVFWRKSGERCLLALGQPCPFFETAVLPMQKRTLWPTSAQGAAFAEAARLYRSTFLPPETASPIQTPERMCPDCGKHRIEPRKRCCVECRIRLRKATDAVNHRDWRKTAGQRHTVNGNGSSPRAASRAASSDTRYHDPAESVSTLNCITHNL